MGMKIKQESRVKTFFKKLFKLSRKKNKDGSWRHSKLESDALFGASSDDSGLDVIKPETDSNITNYKDDIEVIAINYENNCECSADNANLPNEGNMGKAKKKKKDKKWKVKLSPKSSRLVEIKEYDQLGSKDTVVSSDPPTDKTKRKNKLKKKDKKMGLSLISDFEDSNKDVAHSPDQELIDVDLDLVLSSFQSHKSLPSSESEDNNINESRSLNVRQVEVQVEPQAAHTQRSTPVETSNDTQITQSPQKSSQSKKSKRRNKNKKNPADEIDSSPVDFDFTSTDYLVSNKSSKKRNKKNKKDKTQNIEALELHPIEEIVPDTSCIIPERDNNHDNDREDFILDIEKPKKNKKNKKKKNVRRPEDDLEIEILEQSGSSKRPKHQSIWDAEVLTDQEELPVMVEEQKPKKKLRRRRLRIKFNKEKKKLNVKTYDEMSRAGDDDDDIEKVKDTEKQRSIKQVGRRLWGVCKAGWKYMKAGLVYYTRTPVPGNFNHLVKRYEDDDDSCSIGTRTY